MKIVVFSFLTVLFLFNQYFFAQATIKVRVVSVQTLNNVDCDGLYGCLRAAISNRIQRAEP